MKLYELLLHSVASIFVLRVAVLLQAIEIYAILLMTQGLFYKGYLPVTFEF